MQHRHFALQQLEALDAATKGFHHHPRSRCWQDRRLAHRLFFRRMCQCYPPSCFLQKRQPTGTRRARAEAGSLVSHQAEIKKVSAGVIVHAQWEPSLVQLTVGLGEGETAHVDYHPPKRGIGGAFSVDQVRVEVFRADDDDDDDGRDCGDDDACETSSSYQHHLHLACRC